MPDDTPTAWWCPECGAVIDHVQRDATQDHYRTDDIGGLCQQEKGHPVEVPLLTPGLSLVQLAATLKAAGYDARDGWEGTEGAVYSHDDIPWAEPRLVVAVKEKTGG